MTSDTNVEYYHDGSQVDQDNIIRHYGLCWICKGTSGRPIIAFDRASKIPAGYSNLCERCIPAAKVLAALCRWRKP